MRRPYLILSYLFYLFLFAACNEEDVIVKTPVLINKYNPNLPVSVDRIKPSYGGIDQTFVIEGNFNGDVSNMRVYFGTKKAILVATDGSSITGVVPKQYPGYNSVSVVCGQDSLAPGITFKYKQTKSVKTIAGKFGEGNDYVDGDINAARFKEASHIATVKGQKGDNVVVIESWWNDRIRLISLDDNKVVTLNTGMSAGTPAVNSTRERFYTMGHWPDQHKILSFSRDETWTPRMTGITILQSDLPGHVMSCTFAEDDRYLYVLDGEANLVCVDLKSKSYEKITYVGYTITRTDWTSHLVYSKFHKCFFASFTQEAGIIKLYDDNGTWRAEKYAGFNGAGSAIGHRLKDAQFIEPCGMAINEDGEIFVLSRNGWSGSWVGKISGDQVELVAGKPGSSGEINGDPLEARFNSAQDITIDFEGNFYIAGGWDRTVRKLSIE